MSRYWLGHANRRWRQQDLAKRLLKNAGRLQCGNYHATNSLRCDTRGSDPHDCRSAVVIRRSWAPWCWASCRATARRRTGT